jgi:hypothetical protein
MDTTSSWILGLAIFGIRFIATEATFERSSRRGEVNIYRPVIGLRLCFSMGLPIFLIGAVQIARQGNLREDWRFLAGFLALAFGMIVFWPSTIVVTRSGISASRWLGIKPVAFTWSEVEYASREPDGNIRIVAKHGGSITHTKYHVDPIGFVAEIRKYIDVF